MTNPDQATSYLEPTQDSGRAFVMRRMTGNVVMLNLLRFCETADFSKTPELAPEAAISGAAAFQRHIDTPCPTCAKRVASCCFWEPVALS